MLALNSNDIIFAPFLKAYFIPRTSVYHYLGTAKSNCVIYIRNGVLPLREPPLRLDHPVAHSGELLFGDRQLRAVSEDELEAPDAAD